MTVEMANMVHTGHSYFLDNNYYNKEQGHILDMSLFPFRKKGMKRKIIYEIAFLIASNVSLLISCSILQASSSATLGLTPSRVSHEVKSW